VLVAVGLLAGCTDGQPEPAATSPTVAASETLPETRGEPHESELPATWDERPDGPAPTPADQLDARALHALLRTRAEQAATATTCAPDDVELALAGFDVATGHRYTSVVVTNTADEPCTLAGRPGLGARGEWGRAFTNPVERGLTVDGSDPGRVRLQPGGRAASLLEWTGALAGAEDERAALLVVQLAAGQVPVGVPAEVEGALPDIGTLTTLAAGPFEAYPRA